MMSSSLGVTYLLQYSEESASIDQVKCFYLFYECDDVSYAALDSQ